MKSTRKSIYVSHRVIVNILLFLILFNDIHTNLARMPHLFSKLSNLLVKEDAVMSEDEQLNITLLQSYLDSLNVAIIDKMLTLYQQQSVAYFNEIVQAIEQQSQECWQESCHKLKGASASTGLLKVHQALVVLEKSTIAWQQKAKEVSELVSINEKAMAAFKQWLANA